LIILYFLNCISGRRPFKLQLSKKCSWWTTTSSKENEER